MSYRNKWTQRRARQIVFVFLLCLWACPAGGQTERFCVVATTKATETERFAAEQLSHYLQRITGEVVPVRNKSDHGEVPLSVGGSEVPGDLAEDGYVLQSTKGGLALVGASPRGTLYAVYDFLERLGCRWYYMDAEDEIVPHLSRNEVLRVVKAGLHVCQEPDFPIRMRRFIVYDLGQKGTAISQAIMQNLPALIDWTAKNRINIFQYALDHNWDCYGHWKYYRNVFPEMRKRSLVIGAGGHCLFMFFSPDEFKEHPEWFPMVGGRRQPKGQFCTRNEEAVSHYISNMVRFLKDNPEIAYFAPWPNDTGGWCQCPLCKETPSADRFMELGHRIYEQLKNTAPKVRVTHFAYGSHVAPPEKARPLPGMTVTLCTWGRDLSVPIADEGTSKVFRRTFASWRQIAADVNVDMIFHGKYARHLGLGFHPLPLDILQADCRWFRQQGLAGFELPCAYMGRRTKSLNLYVLAKLMWDADADVEALLNDYFDRFYVEAAGYMRSAYEEVELAQPDLRYWAHNYSLSATRLPAGRRFPQELRDYVANAKRHLEQAEHYVQLASNVTRSTCVRNRIMRFWQSLAYTQLEWTTLGLVVEASEHLAQTEFAEDAEAYRQKLDAAERLLGRARELSDRRQELAASAPGSGLYWDVTGSSGPYGLFKDTQIDDWLNVICEKREAAFAP